MPLTMTFVAMGYEYQRREGRVGRSPKAFKGVLGLDGRHHAVHHLGSKHLCVVLCQGGTATKSGHMALQGRMLVVTSAPSSQTPREHHAGHSKIRGLQHRIDAVPSSSGSFRPYSHMASATSKPFIAEKASVRQARDE